MATIETKILDAALEDGLIGPQAIERPYYHRSLLQVNRLLRLLEQEPGLDRLQLQARSDLHPNTVAIYLRWTERRGLVQAIDQHATGRPKLYYLSSFQPPSALADVIALLDPLAREAAGPQRANALLALKKLSALTGQRAAR